MATAREDLAERSMLSASAAESLDRTVSAGIGRLTAGIAPGALIKAYADWLFHLALAPGKRARLLEKATRKVARLATYSTQCAFATGTSPCIDPLPQDHRFRHAAWQQWPFSLMYQSFLLNQQWWHNATTHVNGVSQQDERIVNFTTRQWLDMFSPSNFLLTNPELLGTTLREGGQNLFRGWHNLMDDMKKRGRGRRRDIHGDIVGLGPRRMQINPAAAHAAYTGRRGKPLAIDCTECVRSWLQK